MKYGLWEITNYKKIKKEGDYYLSCKCKCGTERDVRIKNLKSGMSKSCGCVSRKKTSNRNFKHGLRYTKTWRIWQAMKNRCYNKNVMQYKNYGGRGIKVCNKWKEDFIEFYKDVGEAPKRKTLDRINNNGNYEPGNVKWSTPKQQCRNKTNNKKINGKCLTQIDKELGGKNGLVGKRLKRGWEVNRAITEKSHAIK